MSAGGSSQAADQAAAQEQSRQAAIVATQGRVNQVFNDPRRASDIRDYEGAIRDYYTGDLNRQKGDTDRQLRFALARGGLIGGSTQRDQQQQFNEEYGRGLLNVEQKARGAGAGLEAADQDARARLIALATSGLDATTAAQQSAAVMRSNLDAGKSAAMMSGLGDIFGTAKRFVSDAKDAKTRREAIFQGTQNLYAPSSATQFYYGGAKG